MPPTGRPPRRSLRPGLWQLPFHEVLYPGIGTMTSVGVNRRSPGTFSALAVVLILALDLVPVQADAQSSFTSAFDHYTTGYRLDGAHQYVDCESCHVYGNFAGTPTQCWDCHRSASLVRATVQPSTHITTSERCDACHRTAAWVPIARIDHLETYGSCESCHDNRRAAGKPASHLPTGNQCDNCHRTQAWVPAFFDHAGIDSNCASCHNGTTATGKPADHIPATNICEDCHNTMSFSPVARVDHLQVMGTCSSCHNGVIARGQHPQHIATVAECDSCHTPAGWR